MIWLKDNKEVEAPKQVDLAAGTAINPTVEQLQKAGYNCVEPPKCDRKYWIIANNTITEMKQAEKDALDAAELKARQDAEAAQAAAQAAYEADYAARRKAITEAFRADEKQAKAIGELFDAIHGRLP